MHESSERFEDWKFYYFWGVSATKPSALSFQEQQVQALLSAVGADCAVASLAAVEPKYLINHKGTTVWILLLISALMNDKEGLSAVANGTSSLFMPAPIVHGAFSTHVNWPARLLEQYGADFGDHWPFVIPFVRHHAAGAPQELAQSLRSPDGVTEIMGVAEFSEHRPEALLALFHDFHERHGEDFKKPKNAKRGFFSKLFGD